MKKKSYTTEKKFSELVDIVGILRSDRGCPWDRRQKIPDLKNYILEEVYELCDAVDDKNPDLAREEIGDLFLLLVFFSLLFSEKGAFSVNEVLDTINTKLVSRHPHVFTPLEKATGFNRWPLPTEADGGSMPPSAHTVREQGALTGFTSKKLKNHKSVLNRWIKDKNKRKNRQNLSERIPKSSPALLSINNFMKESKYLKKSFRKDIIKDLDKSLNSLKRKRTKGNLVDTIFYSACLLSFQRHNSELLLKKKAKQEAKKILYQHAETKPKK